MTPGARIAAAIDILAGIEPGGRPADDIAADYLRRRRYIGAKDRVQISAHVYAVLRHRAALDWWIARASHGAVEAAAPQIFGGDVVGRPPTGFDPGQDIDRRGDAGPRCQITSSNRLTNRAGNWAPRG